MLKHSLNSYLSFVSEVIGVTNLLHLTGVGCYSLCYEDMVDG